jgi:hypothetical protein
MAECLINGGTPRQALAAAGWHGLHASDLDILWSLENDLNDVHRALLQDTLAHIRELENHVDRPSIS